MTADAAAAAPAPAAVTPAADPAPAEQSALLNQTPPETAEDPQAEEPKAEEPQGAPETYEEFKMPEGIQIDAKALESFTPIAKELNLTQDQAQKLVDVYAQQVEALHAAQVQQMVETRRGWREQVENDQEIGGAKVNENVGQAIMALSRYATPELRQALEESGLGDHPEMVRFCYRVGKALAEDQMPTGNTPVPERKKSAAELLYPNQSNI